jgi:DNA-binding transcriptional regulator YdaS (Cro superfamily)
MTGDMHADLFVVVPQVGLAMLPIPGNLWAMQLKSFIQASGLPDQHFAEKLGVSLSGLRKWKARNREPDAATIARIEALTDGKVSLADWAMPKPKPVQKVGAAA